MTAQNDDACVKCGAAATFSSPADLCDSCWAAWWNEGVREEFGDAVYKREMEETLKSIKDNDT